MSDLAQLLRNAGGRKTADALAEFCQRLQPYRERKLKDLVDLLDKAEEIVRTGTPPARTSGARKPKADPTVIQNACNRVVELYNRATDPSTTPENVDHGFAALEQLDLPVKRLEEVARELDIRQKFRRKADLLNAMKQAVTDRRGAHGRVQV
jgi:hypothetical protein